MTTRALDMRFSGIGSNFSAVNGAEPCCFRVDSGPCKIRCAGVEVNFCCCCCSSHAEEEFCCSIAKKGFDVGGDGIFFGDAVLS